MERELKLVFHASQFPAVSALIRQSCHSDPSYSFSTVSTINFDTKDLFFCREKLNSDLIKRKARLRWYSDPSSKPEPRSYLELKGRRNHHRLKIRKALELGGAEIEKRSLLDPVFQELLHEDFISYLKRVGHLFPVLHATYDRERFHSSDRAWRISLDHSLRVKRFNPQIFSRARIHHSCFDVFVVEFKGRAAELPAEYRFLCGLDPLKKAFSKYSFCCMQART